MRVISDHGIKPCIATLTIFFLLPFEGSGQTYPVKPVRLVVGTTPGGGGDTIARLIAPKLSEYLGQQVVVENRPGAAGAIATERVAKSPPDGYTLQMVTGTAIIVAALRRDLPFDMERDLVPISLVTTAPLLLVVHPSLPARNVRELVALGSTRPGTLDFASTGAGSPAHLAGELFNLLGKTRINHVPYKGAGESVIATAAGEIPINFPSLTSALPLLSTGKFRALAVTGARRASSLPSVPTVQESGIAGYDYSVWFGIFAPSAVHRDIVTLLNTVIGKAVNTAEMRESINGQGQEVLTNSPAQFSAFMRSEIEKTVRLVKAAGLRPE